MIETAEMKRLEKRRKVHEMAKRLADRKQKMLDDMFKVYDRFILEGHTTASAITQTSNETGIPRTTVSDRVRKRYGKSCGVVSI